MKTIRDVLELKGRSVLTISPEESVFTALGIMAEHEVGSLIVVNGGFPIGVISERDYARKVALHGRISQETPVRDIMMSPVVSATAEQTVEQGLSLMSHKRVRHLPVLHGSRLVGIVSIGDLVAAVIQDQKFVIDQLEHYIAG